MLCRLPIASIIALLFVGAARTALASSPAPEPEPAFRAPADSSRDSARTNGNRLRLQAGVAGVLQKSLPPQPFPFANLDYRWGPALHPERAFSMGPIAEIGVNMIIPYGKLGLEMRSGDFFLDAHGGVTVGLFAGGHDAGFGMVFFAGACTGYLFTLGSVHMELETGFNLPGIDPSIYIPYATLGVAL
jgi:hypothetical protein